MKNQKLTAKFAAEQNKIREKFKHDPKYGTKNLWNFKRNTA